MIGDEGETERKEFTLEKNDDFGRECLHLHFCSFLISLRADEARLRSLIDWRLSVKC